MQGGREVLIDTGEAGWVNLASIEAIVPEQRGARWRIWLTSGRAMTLSKADKERFFDVLQDLCAPHGPQFEESADGGD